MPLVGLYTAHIHAFNMIIVGSFVSGLSVFILCIGAHYWTSILFIVVLSVGEVIYSPRVYEVSGSSSSSSSSSAP